MINDADRVQLEALVGSRSMPHSLVRRAQMVLLSGEGVQSGSGAALWGQRAGG